MKGVFQGSILGPILFNIFMNNLSYAIDRTCILFAYADDTQLFKSEENIDQVEHAINADLKKVDVWYEFNQTRKIIQNIKTNWNSLASLPIVSLNVRARCVKSVAELVNRLLFLIV